MNTEYNILNTKLTKHKLILPLSLPLLKRSVCDMVRPLIIIINYHYCVHTHSALPLSPGTCELAPCTACDEEVSGPLFAAFGGRTRRNSGIITARKVGDVFDGNKRPCSIIANIEQPVLECS